jgi:hypothetical protein
MNQNVEKNKREHSLAVFINKINKNEPNTFGNYFVDLGEVFGESDYQK